jgi:hypothetical protein
MKFVIANVVIVFTLASIILYQLKYTNDSKGWETRLIAAHGKTQVLAQTTLATSATRNPAAIQKDIHLFPKTSDKIKDLAEEKELIKNLECRDHQKVITTKNDSITLRGIHCIKAKKVRITNLSNGYTASVFELSEKKYKTDLIPLTLGANEISIHYEIDAKKSETAERSVHFTINKEN